MSLTEKQAAFVQAYLIDPNGKKAAISAGYAAGSAEVTAAKLLRVPKVAAELNRRRVALQVQSGVTPEKVLAELAKLGFADIRQVIEWHAVERQLFDEKGEPADVPAVVVSIKDSDDMSGDAAAAIAEVSQSKDGAIKVKMHDKLGSLVRIGQHLGMFKAPAGADDPGKKEQAETYSKTAQKGTGWDGLLQ